MLKLNYITLTISCLTLLIAFTGITLRYKLTTTDHRIISIIVVIGMLLTVILRIIIYLKEEGDE